MLIKMKESKGFTLVELMIVVAIIGILAAVAVPYYQRYVAKSRLTSLVMPAVHSIETNISTFYAVQNTLPEDDKLVNFLGDSDLTFIYRTTLLDGSEWPNKLKVEINKDATMPGSSGKKPFASITSSQNYFYIVATDPDGSKQKLYWSYEGPLADELGL